MLAVYSYRRLCSLEFNIDRICFVDENVLQKLTILNLLIIVRGLSVKYTVIGVKYTGIINAHPPKMTAPNLQGSGP